MLQLLNEIKRNHELIWALAMKELRVRYKRSILGFVWALLNPLMMMVILTVVFSQILRFQVPNYEVFLISALLPWIFFSQSMGYSMESIVSNGELLKKVKIAKSVFPLAAVLSNVINFLLSLVPLALILLIVGFPFHWTWIYLPVSLIGLILFTLGCGFFFATANVFFRDVSHIVQIVLSAWFYLSPVMYRPEFLPEQYRPFFRLNPMLYFLNQFRLVIYDGQLPQPRSIVLCLAIGVLALALGYAYFRRSEDALVYYV
jgi:homopolymeric O-antigen transport system permease protein